MEQSYKEKYEQAIERLKQWDREHPCAGYVLSDRDKFIFPELAENKDEVTRKEIINYFQCQSEEEPTRKEIHNKWIAWLENIPYTIDHEKREGFHLGYRACLEKQGERKPAWSEEDEDYLFLLNSICKDAEEKYRNSPNVLVKKEIANARNWLKSLRPQNTWKPSDEQMGLLQAIINEPNNAASESCQIVLKDILEQLKKLKEE